ncbi:MAG: glycosyltransferase [Clostridia bacterium]|nr:glycosyltransferase [Clostridia bacterium]
MKRAIVVSMMRYPDGDAGAVRAHAIAKILNDGGYDVTVLGYGPYTGRKTRVHDGIKYTSMRKRGEGFFSKVISRLTHPMRTMKYIKKEFSRVDLIVVDYLRLGAITRLTKYAERTGVRICHDSCEWFSAEEFENGEKNRLYRYAERLNTSLIDKPWEVISISSYLDAHFKGRGLNSVRLPVVMDVSSMEYALPENRERLVFVYAGSPGKKDFLSEMIAGFAKVKDELDGRFEFHIIGATERAAIEVGGARAEDVSRLGDQLIFHGRVPRSEAVSFVRSADFTVLLRNSDLRYTKAGFPTKVVESLASATPVITNITSDLGMYLVNGENSVISKGYTADEFADAVRYATSLDYDARVNISRGARECAEKNFDYRGYIGILD